MTPQQIQFVIDAMDRTKNAVQGATRGIGRLRNVQDAANKAQLAEQQKTNATLVNMQRMLFQHLLRNNMNHQANSVAAERRHQEMINRILQTGLNQRVQQTRSAAEKMRAAMDPRRIFGTGFTRGGMGQGVSAFGGAMLGSILPKIFGSGKDLLGEVFGGAEDITKEFASLGLEANRFKETVMVSLMALKGNREEAQKLFSLYERLDVVSPFSLDEVAAAGKMLEAFGLASEKYLALIVKSGAGSGSNLSQLVRVIERLNAGIFDRRSLGAVGITQEQLADKGIKFESGGKRVDPVSRPKMLEAGLKILEERWGSVFKEAQGTAQVLFTTMLSNVKRVARAVTTELFDAWKGVLGVVNEVLSGILGTSEFVGRNEAGKKIKEALAVPFNLAARALTDFLGNADQVLDWLSKVLDKQAIEDFILKLAATFTALKDSILGMLGVDPGFFSAKNTANFAQKFFDGIIVGIFGFIKWVYKSAQAVELFVIDLKNDFEMAKNWVKDTIEDIGDTWALMMNSMAYTTKITIEGIMRTFADMADHFASSPFGGQLFRGWSDKIAQSADDLHASALKNRDENNKIYDRMAKNRGSRRSRDTDQNMAYVGDVSRARNRYEKFERDANVNYYRYKNQFGGDRNGIAPPHEFQRGPGANPTPPDVPGTPGYFQKWLNQFLENSDVVEEWTKLWKEAYESGRAGLPEYLSAQDYLIESLKRRAEGLDEETLEGAKAWKDYYDAVGDLEKSVRDAQEAALKYVKQRTGNVGAYYDLFPEGERDRVKREVLPSYLQQQAGLLRRAALGEGNASRQQEILGELLGVGKEYQDLFKDKSGFLSQFNRGGGGSDPLDFILGGGEQGAQLRDMILNGSPNAMRLLDPTERTADNTGAIRKILEGQIGGDGRPYVSGPMVGGQPRPDLAYTGPMVNGVPVTININGGDQQTVRDTVMQVLADAYRRSTGQSPVRRR